MMLLTRVERWDWRKDGALTEPALRQKLEARGYTVSRCEWPAGTVTGGEAQPSERIDAIVSGLLKITIDGESAILAAGDMVFVPRGAIRRVQVVGSSPAQSLSAVYDGDPHK